MKYRLLGMMMAAIMTVAQVAPAFADAAGDVTAMLENMQREMSQMQRTIDQQNLRIQQLESSRVLESPQPNAAISQPAAMTEADWQKGIKDNIGEAIPWLKGVKQGGDFRLRYEAFDYYDFQPTSGATQDRSRNRFRIRLRWGMEKDFADDWKFAFRMATGSTTDNTSTNQTLGNSGYFNFKQFNIERAFVTYAPNSMKDYGAIKGVKIAAGKTDNPFLRYSTGMVWDGDVTPEGIYEQATVQLYGSEENKVNLNLTAGQFITNENSALESDAGLNGYQAAVNWSTYNFGTDLPVDFSLAGSYYDYTNWFQTVANNSASTSYLRTNTLAADTFRVVDIYPEIQFYVNRQPVTLWADYAKNVGIEGTESGLSLGNDIHDQDTGWGAGAKIGKIKKKGDWEAHYGYYEIGANAVVAAFNDSDFGGPGGNGHTNRQGHKFGVGYGLTDAVSVNWTGYLVEPLNPSTLVANSTNESVFRSQLDVNFKF